MMAREITNLLCLPTAVTSLILQYLKGPEDVEKGRMKTILNLREVCKTTKGWIDNEVGEKEGRKLFSKCQIHVDLSAKAEATLERFLEHPPLRHISSLSLCGVSNARRYPKAFRRFSEFIEFWTTTDTDDFNGRHYIESLYLDRYNTECTISREFACSPNLASLRKFSCGKITGSLASEWGGILPTFFSQLQEFELNSSPDTIGHNLNFYNSLVESSTIKKVTLLHETCEWSPFLWWSLRQLIKQKKEDPDFQLKIAVPQLQDTWSIRGLHTAIEESKSTVRIVEINEKSLREERVLSEEKRMEFRRGVETIHALTSDIGNINDPSSTALLMESEANFPNLKRIVIPSDHFLLFGSILPHTLAHAARHLNHSNLSSLTLNNVQYTGHSLVAILDSFSTGLPNLSTLEIKWKPPQDEPFYKIKGDEESKFRKLTTLDFTVDVDATKGSAWEAVVSAQGVLLRGLGLLHLPLRKLAVEVTTVPWPEAKECFERLFQHDNFLERLCESRMCQTLAEIVVSRDVNVTQRDLWQKLMAKVEENYVKRVRTHGFVRGQLA